MANPKKKTSKKADAADSDSQEKKRALFQKAAGLLGYHPDEFSDPNYNPFVDEKDSKQES